MPGTIGRLSKTADVNRYFRAIAAASPRVRVFSLGTSEEGREMLVAAVADEATIRRLDDYRAMTARLADPRGLTEAERAIIQPAPRAPALPDSPDTAEYRTLISRSAPSASATGPDCLADQRSTPSASR